MAEFLIIVAVVTLLTALLGLAWRWWEKKWMDIG